mmetsp:Transcript_97999/g.224708  ORF Transcript_97999/g.224708 Transcript_97999/m.224708 type:complete len:765 (+) Transcript_97999:32-2326(+)
MSSQSNGATEPAPTQAPAVDAPAESATGHMDVTPERHSARVRTPSSQGDDVQMPSTPHVVRQARCGVRRASSGHFSDIPGEFEGDGPHESRSGVVPDPARGRTSSHLAVPGDREPFSQDAAGDFLFPMPVSPSDAGKAAEAEVGTILNPYSSRTGLPSAALVEDDDCVLQKPFVTRRANSVRTDTVPSSSTTQPSSDADSAHSMTAGAPGCEPIAPEVPGDVDQPRSMAESAGQSPPPVVVVPASAASMPSLEQLFVRLNGLDRLRVEVDQLGDVTEDLTDGELFARMESKLAGLPLDREDQDLISGDCDRSRSEVARDPLSRGVLERILTFYCYRFQCGYKQGLHEIVSVCLCLSSQPARRATHAYVCFVQIMERLMPCISMGTDKETFSAMCTQFRLLGNYHSPKLFWLLDQGGIIPDLFAFKWFATIFAASIRHLPTLVGLWLALLDHRGEEPLGVFFFALAWLQSHSEKLLACGSGPRLMEQINAVLSFWGEHEDVPCGHIELGPLLGSTKLLLDSTPMSVLSGLQKLVIRCPGGEEEHKLIVEEGDGAWSRALSFFGAPVRKQFTAVSDQDCCLCVTALDCDGHFRDAAGLKSSLLKPLDMRSRSKFQSATMPSAVHVDTSKTLSEKLAQQLLAAPSAERRLVVVFNDHGTWTPELQTFVQELQRRGVPGVAVLKGGYQAFAELDASEPGPASRQEDSGLAQGGVMLKQAYHLARGAAEAAIPARLEQRFNMLIPRNSARNFAGTFDRAPCPPGEEATA